MTPRALSETRGRPVPGGLGYLPSVALMLLAVSLSSCISCEDECDFDVPRCDGNVLETCADGPDQIVPRRIGRTECDGLNPVCVSDVDGAACAASAEFCDESTFESSCDGTVRTHCSVRYVQAVDCASYGPACVIHEGEAKCGIDPPVACEYDMYLRHCEGNTLRACTSGIESAAECEVRCYEDPENEVAYCTQDE